MTSPDRPTRRSQRLRELMLVLEREPTGLAWRDAWPRVIEAYPLVDEDRELTTSGVARVRAMSSGTRPISTRPAGC